MTEHDNLLEQVKRYQGLVQQYEDLDREIDTLITEHDGSTEKMSAEAMQRYRAMARERAEVLNEMMVLERDLLSDEDDEF